MKNIQFNLEDIKILRSDCRDHPIVFKESFNFNNLSLDIGANFNFTDEFAQVFMHFQFDYEEHEIDTITLSHFDIAYTFEVNELKEVISNEESLKFLQLAMLGIAYSTSRGIIFSETKGFAINEFYLGPITANKLFESLVPKSEETV